MKDKFPIGIIIGIITTFLLGLVAMLIIGLADRSRSSLPILGALPKFEFLKQDGAPFGLDDLKGKISVVDFIFTTCPGICPVMSSNMAELYHEFRDAPNVQFVSITVDPGNDSLEILRDYARKFGVTDGRWVFLWHPLDDVVNLCEKGFMLTASDLPQGHSSRFVLVDQNAGIRGYYDGTDDASMKKLSNDVSLLARNL